MSKKKNKKEPSICVGFRLPESEHRAKEKLCQDEHGNQLMSVGILAKKALKKSRPIVVDSVVEQYKAFVGKKISNNINQIAKAINTAARNGNLDDRYALATLIQIEQLYRETRELTRPIRGGK